MPFIAKSPGQLKAPISRAVRQARAHLTATGWSYRAAAPEVGVTWQHLAQVLTGLRHSKSLVDRVLSLPHR